MLAVNKCLLIHVRTKHLNVTRAQETIMKSLQRCVAFGVAVVEPPFLCNLWPVCGALVGRA